MSVHEKNHICDHTIFIFAINVDTVGSCVLHFVIKEVKEDIKID